MTKPDEKPKRGLDPELQVMAKIDRLFDELTTTQQERVLHWLTSRINSRMVDTIVANAANGIRELP